MEQLHAISWNHWPGAFGLFFLLGMGTLVVGIWGLGRRWGEEPLRWSLLLLTALGFGLATSKLYMFSAGDWSALADGDGLPHTTGKNLLGGVLGGTLAALAAGTVLKCRARVAEAWGLILPAAVLIGRFGCLLAGCCHGTVSDVPWAVTYPSGSLAFIRQVAEGSLAPGAAVALPVHPVQLYEIAGLAVLAALIFLAHARFRSRVFLIMIGGYGILRFSLEFVRWGGDPIAGLKPVQWALLPVAFGALAGAWLHSRRSGSETPAAGPGPARQGAWAGSSGSCFAVAVVVMPVLGAAAFWFSPLERAALLIAASPAVAYLAEAAGCWLADRLGWRTRALPVCACVVVLAAGPPLAFQRERKTDAKHNLRVSGGVGGGRATYQETCGDQTYEDPFVSGRLDVAYRQQVGRRTHLDVGVDGYAARVWRTVGPREGAIGEDGEKYYDTELHLPLLQAAVPTPYWLVGIEPYAGMDFYFVAFIVGLHIFGSPQLDDVSATASGYLRVGARDVIFIEGGFLHGQFSPMPMSGFVGGGVDAGAGRDLSCGLGCPPPSGPRQ